MENKPQIGLGEYLRGERERRHITIEQVASATKINIKLLHALESDNYDALPAKPFVRGFVTSYTRYVGLDHREVLARFDPFLDEKSGQKFRRPEDAPHIFVEREGHSENSKTWLSIAMVGFIVGGVLLFAILKPSLHHHRGHSKDKAPITNEELVTVVPPPSDGTPIVAPAQPKTLGPAPAPSPATAETAPVPSQKTDSEQASASVPPVPPVPSAPSSDTPEQAPAKKEPVAAAEQSSSPASTPAQKPATTPPNPTTSPSVTATGTIKVPPIPSSEVKYRLVVHAIDDAWVKYQVDDRPVQQYTLKKDKTIWVRARESLRFTTAKPAAIEISRDNKEFKPFGSTAKTIIVPKEAEEQFKASPFVPPNPAYLSTSNH